MTDTPDYDREDAYFERVHEGCRDAIDAAGGIPGSDARIINYRLVIEALVSVLINMLAEAEPYADVELLHTRSEQIAQLIREQVPKARAFKRQSARKHS